MKFEIDDKTKMLTFLPPHPLSSDGSIATVNGKKYTIHPPFNLESLPLNIKKKINQLLNLQRVTSKEIELILYAVRKAKLLNRRIQDSKNQKKIKK